MQPSFTGLCAWAFLAPHLAVANAQFNNPPGVDIWCGKAYRPGNSSFDPGGWFEEPPISHVPLLDLRVRPRMSIYLDTDTTAHLLIDAGISNQTGQPFPNVSLDHYGGLPGDHGVVPPRSPHSLDVAILLDGSVLQVSTIRIGATDMEVPLDLDVLPPQMGAYNVSIRATLNDQTTYETSTSFSRLPTPDNYGSVSRIDNLYGDLWVKRGREDWHHIFPYTYYVQWTLFWEDNVTTLNEFAEMGYNVIHIVPTGALGEKPFPWDEFEPYLQRADELGLYFQYDVIWEWDNLTGMVEQVERLRHHPSMLLWYQSDEPDGKSNPLNSTGIAYNLIRELDPYHPVSLALNCYDFYYADYAAGADIILTDTYPIAINATFSPVYDTVCNLTYGDCGCDDCRGTLSDISERIDEFRRRDHLLGWAKTQWYAPQAFGNETFWARYPSAAEEAAMTLLAINHGAMGIVMWNYPTSAELSGLTRRLAAVLTRPDVTDFLLEAPRRPLRAFVDGGSPPGPARLDAALWVGAGADPRQALIGVVHLDDGAGAGPARVLLPDGLVARRVARVLWGDDAPWHVDDADGSSLRSTGVLPGLHVALLLLDLA